MYGRSLDASILVKIFKSTFSREIDLKFSHSVWSLPSLRITAIWARRESEDKLRLKEKALILSPSSAGRLQDANIPTLLEFTVCIDLNATSNAPWTVFSYCVENGERPAELGLEYLDENAFKITHLGVPYIFKHKLELFTWFTVCISLNNLTRQLEAYVNSISVLNTKTMTENENYPPKVSGSLVLGCNHSRKAGIISLTSQSNFIGELYNFQMWNYSKSLQELFHCSEGNLLSWAKEPWKFARPHIDENLRCVSQAVPYLWKSANVTDEPSSTETTPFQTTTTNMAAKTSSTETTTFQTTTIFYAPRKVNSTFYAFSRMDPHVSLLWVSSALDPRRQHLTSPSIKLHPRPRSLHKDSRWHKGGERRLTRGCFKKGKLRGSIAIGIERIFGNILIGVERQRANMTAKPSSTETTFQTTTTNVTAKPFSTETATFQTTATNETEKPSSTKTTTFQPMSNLSTSITPQDHNLSSTKILNTATTNTSIVTHSPALYTTTLTEMGTTSLSVKPPGSQATDQPGLSNSSTQSPITESFPGNDLIINSSMILPTQNNVSITRNISSHHPIHPAATTTSSAAISPWVNRTTIQQVTTYSMLVTTPPFVTTNSGSLPVTMAHSSSRSSAAKSSPSSVTDTQTVTLGIPESFTNDSTTTKGTEPPAGNVTSAKAPMSTTSSDIKGTAQVVIGASTTVFSTQPSTPSHPSTESLGSQSAITNMATVEYRSVSYFVVNVTLKFSDVVTDGDVSSLVKSMMDTFQVNNNDFSVLEINVSEGPSYTAKLVIQANSSGNPESLSVKLQNLLENLNDDQGNITLSVQNVSIKALAKCPAETKCYDPFIYMWPETSPTETAKIRCYSNEDEFILRHCSISVITDGVEWENPDFSRCVLLAPLPNSFEDLENIIVTPENAKYLAEHILNMTTKARSLPENDVRIILSKLSEIIALEDIDVENAKTYLNVINDILSKGENSSLPKFTNQILNITEEIGFKLNFIGENANVTADSMALLVSEVNFSRFEDLYFTVNSYLEGKDIEISLEKPQTDEVVASIYLPEAIKDKIGSAVSKVQFNFLGSLSLFTDNTFHDHKLITYVISATIEGANIWGLDQSVKIELQHINDNVERHPVKCVFWDITKNNNTGGWNTSGCILDHTKDDYTTCTCSHLTHFGVLLDFSRKSINPLDEYIMSLMTYVGCGITSLFLGVTLVTYGMFRQLRKDYPSKILMNLSFSLLMLNLIFLINDWLSSFRIDGLCVSIAALLHYFLLTSFTWMGLEAVHMYFAFVKVFNSYIHKYILKLCIVGWGIPIIIVVAVLSVNVDFYGALSKSKQQSDPGDSSSLFCWIQNDIVFYVTVVVYFCIIFLTNISMFIVVLLQIKSLKATKIKDWKALFLHDIKNTLSLAFLLGLTWGFAFFAWDPVRIAFLYLFTIFNTLQGFFIFVFHCLIKENVRNHWRMYLCCGRCRLDNYSDWSRLSNADTKYNGRIHLSPSDSYQSTRSNNTASTNSSSLSGFSSNTYSGWNDGYGEIFINSARAAPSNRATTYPDSRRTLSFLDFGTQ
ncbi:adhesion G-protein coupled receptor G4 [Mantella aurantiaca]